MRRDVRVLLVEDDREVADYVRRGLEEESFSVTVRLDGASGLKAAETSAFDIIVLDVMLPFLDGLEVTRRLRFMGCRTPILLLTARDAPQDIVCGLDAGGTIISPSPFLLTCCWRASAPARGREPDRKRACATQTW